MEQRRKTIGDFPHFMVSAVEVGKVFPTYTAFHLIGHFDRVEGVVAGNCYLLLPERVALVGDLTSFDPQSGSARFNGAEKTVPAVQGARLPYLGYYWQPFHIWMIVDDRSQWERVSFHAVDAISESFTTDDGRRLRKVSKLQQGQDVPPEAQVVTLGWDHEHCELCSTHIHPGDCAYTNTDGLWACVSCFENYIGPKNLSFVDEC